MAHALCGGRGWGWKMGHVTKSPCQPGRDEGCGLPALHAKAGDFRTMLKLYLLDPVLPLVALASMSALTVATIVLVATTVAGAGLHIQDGAAQPLDPWSGWCFGPASAGYADLMGADEPGAPAEIWLEASYLARELPGR